MKPLLSIVTGTLNREASFERLLKSIQRATASSWELVVSDASDEPYALDLPPNVTMIPERPRQGCSKGYNNAFRRACGDWVIWLNDDCEVLPDYDLDAISFMKRHPKIGLGCLYYSEDDSPFHINSAWQVPYANFGIIKRTLGEHIGWLDPDITMYGMDNAITFRVLDAGYGVAGIPTAKVIHHSEKDQAREENQRTRMRDNAVLQAKYLSKLQHYRDTYQRHKIMDELAWSHGVRP